MDIFLREKVMKNEPVEVFVKRIVMALTGVILCGFSVGFYQKVALGADPFTCLTTAFANLFHTTYGAIYPFVTGAFLIAVFFINRHYIGIATIINLFGTGVAADFMYHMLDKVIPDPGMGLRAALMIFAVVLGSFAASLYFTADLGVSAYDAVALTAANKYRLAAFRVCRISTDVVCVVVGLIFHVTVGIGTVITALCMGPVIQWFNTHFSEPFLNAEKRETEGSKTVRSGNRS